MSWGLGELERRLANIIRAGVVEALDASVARVRVRSGDLLTDWLPWLTQRAGADRTWWAPEPGEQVLVLAQSGDLAQGFVLPALYRAAHPPPADQATIHRTEYADGAVFEYDKAASRLTIRSPGEVVVRAARTLTADFDGVVTVRSGTHITIDAPTVTVTGDLTVEGRLTYLAGMSGSTGGSDAAAMISGSIHVVDGDVTAGGTSLRDHVHTGDSGGTTTAPTG